MVANDTNFMPPKNRNGVYTPFDLDRHCKSLDMSEPPPRTIKTVHDGKVYEEYGCHCGESVSRSHRLAKTKGTVLSCVACGSPLRGHFLNGNGNDQEQLCFTCLKASGVTTINSVSKRAAAAHVTVEFVTFSDLCATFGIDDAVILNDFLKRVRYGG